MPYCIYTHLLILKLTVLNHNMITYVMIQESNFMYKIITTFNLFAYA